MNNKMKIKKGDKVVVLSGKDKGKTGEVTRSIPSERKVVVKGVNMVKIHQKPTQTTPGGIVEMEKPIFACKVALVDPKTGKATKVKFEKKDERKVRIAKKSGEIIDG